MQKKWEISQTIPKYYFWQIEKKLKNKIAVAFNLHIFEALYFKFFKFNFTYIDKTKKYYSYIGMYFFLTHKKLS